MSFPRYPKYKDSGVEWLGEVPEHWTVSQLKRIVSMPITDGPHETPEFVDEGVPFVSAEAVSSGRIDFTKVRACISAEDNARYSQKYAPRRHDIFMVKSGATTGITAIVEDRTDFNIWSPLAVIRCNERNIPRFVLNFMRSRNFQEAVALNWSFGTQQNIGMGVIENLPCILPPIAEQAVISKFLDGETKRVDDLVAEQQRLMDLLKEKRQAVISHAVTKGLNPRAPMKPSGMEWLDDVPAHWDVVSVRRVVRRIEQGWSPECFSRPAEDDEWGVLKAGCVNRGLFSEQENKALPDDLEPVPGYEIHPGNVLMSRASGSPDLVGSTAFITKTRPRLMLSDKIFRVHPESNVDPRFFVAVFNSNLMRSQIERAISGAEGLANNLPQSSLKAFVFPVPPLDEQEAIANYIASRCGELDALAAEAQKAIDLLQERRTALISAAVTGQIDVRKLAAA
jgi:type I restriction enzyme S subunit